MSAGVAVIGAGPAGLGAAWKLAARCTQAVTVLERGENLGGNAGSFDLDGMRVDFGSHRLHPACDLSILNDIRNLLGADLLERPRHGRIRLLGHWVHFPLKPTDLLTQLPWSFGFSALFDGAAKRFAPRSAEQTFATILQEGLGQTICREFYFPYARKIWGLEPEQLHAEQARRRVSAHSIVKLLRKALSSVPGFRLQGSGRFFYPKQGFGQISEVFAGACVAEGADLILGATVERLERSGEGWEVRYCINGQSRSIDAQAIFSTIPVTALARLLDAPEPVAKAARALRFRAMILIYLTLEVDRYTEFDAHYFPGREIPITRMSEPKNYSLTGPRGTTVLCAELPCDVGDAVWNLNNNDLGRLFCDSLEAADLPAPSRIRTVTVKRLPQAYPIYTLDFFEHFEAIDEFLNEIPNLVTFGRQGLFVHDNTHHALRMAYAAVECFHDGGFDRRLWNQWRKEFASHVVED